MNRRLLPAFAALVLWATPAFATAPQSPEAFGTALYAGYSRPDAPGPLNDPDTARVFTPRLSAAIHADQTRHPGDVGKLDHDPICDCQDSDGLRLDHVAIHTASPTTATAVVAFHLGDTLRSVRLALIRTHIGWQVDDVTEQDMPSLRRLLATP